MCSFSQKLFSPSLDMWGQPEHRHAHPICLCDNQTMARNVSIY